MKKIKDREFIRWRASKNVAHGKLRREMLLDHKVKWHRIMETAPLTRCGLSILGNSETEVTHTIPPVGERCMASICFGELEL